MPKAKRKAKKAKAKSKGKAKGKKTDGRERGSLALLTAVVDKLGASINAHTRNKLIVSHFNHPPFVIDLKTLKIEDAPETTNVSPQAA